MPRQSEMPAPEALNILAKYGTARCVDVRSPGEFLKGSIPRSTNLPILNDQERHEVGLCYKLRGQAAAVELGHRLVADDRGARVQGWKVYLKDVDWPFVACWRGGMRSQIAAEWIREESVRAIRIAGHKSMRNELLKTFETLPEFYVLSGPTGSGKTGLLRSGNFPKLDLEQIARHRGSAFGQYAGQPQPQQADFENAISFDLRTLSCEQLLVEDESSFIGRVYLPAQLIKKIRESPAVNLRVDLMDRVANIQQEYITEPLHQGIPADTLKSCYEQSLQRISKKLGGLMTQKIRTNMILAFDRKEIELHRDWIRDLLVHYYDNAYAHGVSRVSRKTAFEGDWNECQTWIQRQFA